MQDGETDGSSDTLIENENDGDGEKLLLAPSKETIKSEEEPVDVIAETDDNAQESATSDIVRNRIGNTLSSLYSNGASNNDEDSLAREIMEMRRSAQEVDELEGLIDRPDSFPHKPSYVYGAKSTVISAVSSVRSVGSSNTNSAAQSRSGLRINNIVHTTLPIIPSVTSPLLSDVPNEFAFEEETREDKSENQSRSTTAGEDRLSVNFRSASQLSISDLSRASSSMSEETSDTNEENEKAIAEAKAKTYEDETLQRYLKIPPEERERLKNLESELPIKFDDFIALHGFGQQEQKDKIEKRDDILNDSISFIDAQSFAYDDDIEAEPTMKSTRVPRKELMEKSSHRRRVGFSRRKQLENKDVEDYEQLIDGMKEEEFNEIRNINKEKRKDIQKHQRKRNAKTDRVEKHGKLTQEMFEKAERRSKIFSDLIESKGIITETTGSLMPVIEHDDVVEEVIEDQESVASSKSFFITENNVQEKGKALIERKLRGNSFRLKSNHERFLKRNSDPVEQATKELPYRMPSISRSSVHSSKTLAKGQLSHWYNVNIAKRGSIRVMDSMESGRAIGVLMGSNKDSTLPKIV